MAITDAGKQFEDAWSGTDPKTFAVTAAIKAGSIVAIYFGGRRSAAALSLTSVTDTKGNVYQIRQNPSSTRFAAIAWTRTTQAMGTADRITANLSGGPGYCWASGHVFEGASDVPIATVVGWANSSNVQATVAVTGSDWLTLGVFILPYEASATITPVNSSVSQDDCGNVSSTPWIEGFSRNGTTGTTHTIGGTVTSPVLYAAVAISLPALALPSGGRPTQSVVWL